MGGEYEFDHADDCFSRWTGSVMVKRTQTMVTTNFSKEIHAPRYYYVALMPKDASFSHTLYKLLAGQSRKYFPVPVGEAVAHVRNTHSSRPPRAIVAFLVPSTSE